MEDRRAAWLHLARRHLEMARLLLQGYADGAFFHVYHALECAVTSEILRIAPGQALPIGHRDKLDLFRELADDSDTSDRVPITLARAGSSKRSALRGLAG